MAEVVRMHLTLEECVEGRAMIAEHRAWVNVVIAEGLFVNTVEGYVRTKASGLLKGKGGDPDIIAQLDDARIKDMHLFETIWTAMCSSISAKIGEMDEQYNKLEEEIIRRERMGVADV